MLHQIMKIHCQSQLYHKSAQASRFLMFCVIGSLTLLLQSILSGIWREIPPSLWGPHLNKYLEPSKEAEALATLAKDHNVIVI